MLERARSLRGESSRTSRQPASGGAPRPAGQAGPPKATMKSNRLRTALAEGRPAVGHMLLEFGTRSIAKIVEASGLDFVLIDMEHSGLDFGAVADLLAWFKSTPVAPIVRVPAIHYHLIAPV